MDAFKGSLVSELGNETAFTIPVLGGIPVSESVVVSWIVMAVLALAALLLTRKLSVRDPGKVQIALESAVQFLNGSSRRTSVPTGGPLPHGWGRWPCTSACRTSWGSSA